MVVDAWSNGPHRGGQYVGKIRLTACPYLERSDRAPAEDYAAEGFKYLATIGTLIDGLTPLGFWNRWMDRPSWLWVIRFELIS